MEDAKLSKLNLCLLKVECSSAFNSIDRTRLVSIMERLGMPNDALQVVLNLYTNATTTITTSAGQCGTVKNDERNRSG